VPRCVRTPQLRIVTHPNSDHPRDPHAEPLVGSVGVGSPPPVCARGDRQQDVSRLIVAVQHGLRVIRTSSGNCRSLPNAARSTTRGMNRNASRTMNRTYLDACHPSACPPWLRHQAHPDATRIESINAVREEGEDGGQERSRGLHGKDFNRRGPPAGKGALDALLGGLLDDAVEGAAGRRRPSGRRIARCRIRPCETWSRAEGVPADAPGFGRVFCIAAPFLGSFTRDTAIQRTASGRQGRVSDWESF
jgi:hypothetical protein